MRRVPRLREDLGELGLADRGLALQQQRGRPSSRARKTAVATDRWRCSRAPGTLPDGLMDRAPAGRRSRWSSAESTRTYGPDTRAISCWGSGGLPSLGMGWDRGVGEWVHVAGGAELSVLRTEDVHSRKSQASASAARRAATWHLVAFGDRTSLAAWVELPDDDAGRVFLEDGRPRRRRGLADPSRRPAGGGGLRRRCRADPHPPGARRSASSSSTGAGHKVVTRIALEIPKGHPLHDAWIDNEGSQGEGAAFMQRPPADRQGEGPSAFIEFGPEGDEPSGFGPGDALAGGGGLADERGDTCSCRSPCGTRRSSCRRTARTSAILRSGRITGSTCSATSRIDRPRRRARPGDAAARADEVWKLPLLDGKPGRPGTDAQRPGDRRPRHEEGEGEPRAPRTADRRRDAGMTTTVEPTPSEERRARPVRDQPGPAPPAGRHARRRGHELRALLAARDDGRAAALRAA